MKKVVAVIESSFIRTYRLYNGLTELVDLPHISGRFYIAKPRIYKRKSTRTKDYSYIEILAQLPQSRTATPPDYILVVISINNSDKMRPRDLKRVSEFINKRIRKITAETMGTIHFFIYFICRKATAGVYEEIKRNYARLRNNGLNIVIRVVSHGEEEIMINDIRKYIEARLKGLLDKKKYDRSNYEVFSYPKRLIEYLLILDALLSREKNIAEEVAFLAHRFSRTPITTYESIFEKLYKKKEKEIRSKEIRSPEAKTMPSLYI